MYVGVVFVCVPVYCVYIYIIINIIVNMFFVFIYVTRYQKRTDTYIQAVRNTHR